MSINALFDLVIAASIGTGLLASHFGRRVSPAYILPLLALPMLAQAPVAISGQMVLYKMLDNKRGFSAVISELAGKEGPVACKSLALCYWAGKEPQIDFFNTDQAILMGAIPLERLLKPIEERRYAAIQLGDSTYNYAATKSQILPAEVNEAIARGYVVGTTEPMSVFVPRTSVSSTMVHKSAQETLP